MNNQELKQLRDERMAIVDAPWWEGKQEAYSQWHVKHGRTWTAVTIPADTQDTYLRDTIGRIRKGDKGQRGRATVEARYTLPTALSMWERDNRVGVVVVDLMAEHKAWAAAKAAARG